MQRKNKNKEKQLTGIFIIPDEIISNNIEQHLTIKDAANLSEVNVQLNSIVRNSHVKFNEIFIQKTLGKYEKIQHEIAIAGRYLEISNILNQIFTVIKANKSQLVIQKNLDEKLKKLEHKKVHKISSDDIIGIISDFIYRKKCKKIKKEMNKISRELHDATISVTLKK